MWGVIEPGLHARGSPLKTAEGAGLSDLLRKDQIDAYLAFLNRHPGRRVDVALSPSQARGEVYLDFLVAEERAWRVYVQRSNTGTDETGDDRPDAVAFNDGY